MTRPARSLACFLLAAADSSQSYVPSSLGGNAPLRVLRARSSLSARLPGAGGTGEDVDADDAAALKPAWQENLEYWAEREREDLDKLNRNPGRATARPVEPTLGNTFAHLFQKKSTEDFKKPYEEGGMDETHASPPPPPRRVDNQTLPPTASAGPGYCPEWFGSNTRVDDEHALPRTPVTPPPPSPTGRSGLEARRLPFQTASTDDFKRPHGMPPGAAPPPPRRVASPREFKKPFQTCT